MGDHFQQLDDNLKRWLDIKKKNNYSIKQKSIKLEFMNKYFISLLAVTVLTSISCKKEQF